MVLYRNDSGGGKNADDAGTSIAPAMVLACCKGPSLAVRASRYDGPVRTAAWYSSGETDARKTLVAVKIMPLKRMQDTFIYNTILTHCLYHTIAEHLASKACQLTSMYSKRSRKEAAADRRALGFEVEFPEAPDMLHTVPLHTAVPPV